uniref:TLDc domain-containing protein n=1 Tax=Rhizophagus irregularis (strain DAOM 181602 / DAOM 197198 / MUCL 43194) TaxID=747089 RepID=U9TKR4_RHIID
MKPKTNLAPRKPNFKYQLDSTLIESDYVPIFASWIDKKDSSHYNRKNIPYDFKLLHRSSQDGNNTLSFHRNCDNKGATIWIARIKNSTQLIGGHGPTMGNLYCLNNAWSYNNNDNGNRYPKIGIPAKFEVEDYEVFQVIKR